MSIRETDDGVVIDVRVQPGAKVSRVVGMHGDAVKIAVAAPPVDGKANTALITFLANLFRIRSAQVELLRGETSRAKAVRLRGVSVEVVQAAFD